MSDAKVALRFWPLWAMLLAALLAGAMFVGWSLRPTEVYRVSSGSMAPTLLGPHYLLKCQRCQISLPLDAAQPLDEQVTCGHCGYQRNDRAAATLRPGEVLALDPASRAANWKPSRWDLVLIEQEGQWSVKRVVGLPGEQVELAAGDVWVDGRQLPTGDRPSGELKILVFDQNHDPPDQSRFLPEQAETGWRVTPGELAYRRTDNRPEPPADRLVYHHLACLPPPQPGEQPSVPRDPYLFNHQVSRQLFPVSDIWIEFRVRSFDEGELTVTLHGEEVDFSRTISADKRDRLIQLGHLDGRFFFKSARVGRWFNYSKPVSNRFRPTNRPFSFSLEGASQVRLTDVRIYRDIHYLGPHNLEEAYRFPQPAQPQHVLVLGDNVPISEDSRYLDGPGIPFSAIRGKVKLAPRD